jgi:crossover junction endodeoxyribonuclease RuvC
MYLGIDPGLHGGACVLSPGGQVVGLTALPVRDGRLDPVAFGLWVRAQPVRHSAVELVGAMPGQGVTSMFTFGEAVGTILGVLGALGQVPVRPRPQAWQGGLGIALPAVKRPKGVQATQAEKAERRAAVKAAALAYAVRLVGRAALIPRGCRVPHDGLVDAVCIADWLRLQHEWLT